MSLAPPAVISGNFTPATPTAPAGIGSAFTPGTPTAPAGIGSAYTPGTPTAPARVNPGFIILPNRPSAFANMPAGAPHFLRITGTLTDGENPVVFPELIGTNETISESGILAAYYTDTGESPGESYTGYVCVIQRTISTGAVVCLFYRATGGVPDYEWQANLPNNTWDVAAGNWAASAVSPATGVPTVESIPFTLLLPGNGDQALAGNERWVFSTPPALWTYLGTYPAAAPLPIS